MCFPLACDFPSAVAMATCHQRLCALLWRLWWVTDETCGSQPIRRCREDWRPIRRSSGAEWRTRACSVVFSWLRHNTIKTLCFFGPVLYIWFCFVVVFFHHFFFTTQIQRHCDSGQMFLAACHGSSEVSAIINCLQWGSDTGTKQPCSMFPLQI